MNPLQSNSFNLSVSGFRGVPPGAVQSAAYTLSPNDVGRYVITTANVTIPATGFRVGDVVSVFNNSSSTISLVTTGTVTVQTAYLAGTDTNRGGSSGSNLTLAARGVATILFTGTNSCVVTGNVT